MSNPIIRIHDLATGDVIDREMTNAEFEEYNAQLAIDAKAAQATADAQAAKEAAQAKLEALGLTTDDLKALGL
jgi:hypothetical protein